MKTKVQPTCLLPKRISLVAQTVQSLSESIRAGHWQKHLPGERELSRRLQVSRDTIRAALEELQRKGWVEVTNGQRRRIKPRRASCGTTGNKVIGVLSPIPFMALPARMANMVDTLREMLTRAGSAVEYHVGPACFSAKPARALEKLVSQNPAVAWVVCGSRQPMQRWLTSRKLPCLILGSCTSSVGLPSIDADLRATCHHACAVLMRRRHKRIALVLPHKGFDGDIESEQGFQELFAEHPECTPIVLRHDGSTAHLRAQLDAAVRLPNPPTAFIVARAMHVLTVMMHLMRCGKRIPQDVAVISRDDDTYLQSTSPDVTRYAMNPTQFARRVSLAVRQLAETGSLPPRAIRLMPEFIVGETV